MSTDRSDTPAPEGLRSAIENLAAPGSDGLARRGCTRPDQLAIDFDESYTAFVAGLSVLPSEAQLEALQNLDRQLESMSDPALQAKWTAQAMKTDPDWETVRSLARAVRSAFEW